MATTIAATWYSPALTITDTLTAVTINSTETVYLTSKTYNDSGTTVGRQMRFTGYKESHDIANFKLWLADTTDVLTSCVRDIGHNMAVLLENKNALVIPQTAKNALIYNPTTKALSKSVACSGYSDGVVRQYGSVVLVPKTATTIKILDETGKGVSTNLQIQLPNPGPTVEYVFESTAATLLVLENPKFTSASDITTTTTYGWGTSIGWNITASSFNGVEVPFRAFDKTFSGFWATAPNKFDGSGYLTNVNDPQWIAMAFPEQVVMKSFSIQFNNESYYTGAGPREFSIQGSNDRSTWTNIKSYTEVTGWSAGQLREFTDIPTTFPSFSNFRILLERSNGHHLITIGEIKFFTSKTVNTSTDTSGNSYLLSLPFGANLISDFKTVKALQLSQGTVAETAVLTSLAETNGGNDYYLLNNNTISFDIYLSAATGTTVANTTGIDILSIGIDNGNSSTTNLGGTPYGYKFSYTTSNTLNYTIYGNDGAGTKLGVSTYGPGAITIGRWIHYDIVWNTTHRPDVYQDGALLTTVLPDYTGTTTNNLRLKHGIGNKTIRFHGSGVTGHRFANFRMYQRQLSATERNCLQSFASVVNGYGGYSGGALTSDNNVVLAPAQANAIAIVSPTNGVSFVTPIIAPFISTDTVFNSSKYSGAVTLQNGKIMFVPNNATKIGLLTLPSTFAEDNAVTLTTPTYDKYSGGVLMQDGRVLLVPSGATTVGIYNPTIATPTFVNGPAATGYSGGTLLNDGRVLLFPKTAPKVAIYNPFSNSITEMSNLTNITDMLYLADNTTFVLQDKATSVSIYQPRDIRANETDIIEVGPAATGYKTQALQTDGRIIFMNNTGTAATATVAVYNPINNKVFTQAASVSYINALPVSDGTFIKGPFNNTRVGRYTNVINGVVPAIKSTYPQVLYSKIFVKAGASFFLTADNKLYACGSNAQGQLGILNGKQTVLFPRLVDTSALTASSAGNIMDVANGYYGSYILTSTGKVFYTSYSYSIFQEINLTSVTNANADPVIQISTMWHNTLFLTQSGKVFLSTTIGGTPGAVITTNIGVGENNKITQVSAGRGHYLLLRNDGKVFSYGGNGSGQCGNGTTATVAIPTEINLSNISLEPSSVITQISAGLNYSLFLTNEGKAFACGNNPNGQLGTNTTIGTNILVPTKIITTNITTAGHGTIAKISAGYFHSVLLTSTNNAYSWGLNNHGQLGLGRHGNQTSTDTIPTLIPVTNLNSENAGTITDVYAGDSNTAVFTASSGKSFACGSLASPDNGFLGTLDVGINGTPTGSNTLLRTVVSDLDGYFSGVSLSNGKVLLVPTSKTSDVRILNTTDNTTTIPTISLGGKISGFSRGIPLSNGNVLLVPSTTSRIGLYNPITNVLSQVANINTYISASYGSVHALFLRKDGKVFACGNGTTGALGNNTLTSTSVPTMMDTTHIGKYGVITQIVASYLDEGNACSYLLRDDGKVFACGINTDGQCGVGHFSSVLIPTPIDTTNIGANGIITQISGYYGAVFLRSDGKAFSCGPNAFGKGGIGGTSTASVSVPTAINITNIGETSILKQVVSGRDWNYYLKDDGKVFRCGFLSPIIPTQISGFGTDIVKNIAHTREDAIFLTTNNKLYRCWRNGSAVEIPTTTFLEGGYTILKIALGSLNGLVLRSDGKVFTIPQYSNGNAFGESGIGVSTTAVTTFTEIITTNIGAGKIIDIGCSAYSAFFTRDDNTIFSCGRDTQGELGLKSINSIVTIPTEVSPRVGYKHGVQVNDGRVVLFSDIDDSVCIYTPDTNTVFFPTTNIKGATYANSTLAPNGKIILTPESATTVGIYTPPRANTINGSSKVTGLLTMTNTVPEPSNTVLTPQNSAKFIKWLTAITSVRYGSWWNSATKPLFSVGATTTGNFVGSVLLKDGRVLFVQSASAATNALIYTPLTNTVALSTGGVAGFQGGVLLANGNVLLVPRTPSGVRIYNPNTNAISGAIGSATGYFGGVLLPNKNVLLVPYSATTIGIYNTAGASFATAAGITLTGGYIGGVLLSDGRVVFVPYIATTVGVYDPIANTLSQNITVPSALGTDRYSGGVLLPDGRVLFVPYSATNIGIYNPFANKGRGSFTTGPAIAGTAKYAGGVLLPDGRVLFIPFNARNIGIYDPITNLFTTPIMYDAAISTSINIDLDADAKYWGGSLLPDGRVVMAPQNATKVGIVSGFPTPKSEMCYHPCFNKF